jgi:preprotein translocase subunit Sss1
MNKEQEFATINKVAVTISVIGAIGSFISLTNSLIKMFK